MPVIGRWEDALISPLGEDILNVTIRVWGKETKNNIVNTARIGVTAAFIKYFKTYVDK